MCVTNRGLCPPGEPFLQRVEQAAYRLAGKGAILLREKDLSGSEYHQLAAECKRIAERYQVPLIVHTHLETARHLHTPLHLSMPLLRGLPQTALPDIWGVSVHHVEEAKEAANRGAAYVIAGHIFSTDCKKGVPARGISFLREVVAGVPIPVYAIGGITVENSSEVFQAGAAGVCMMSQWMAGDLGLLSLPDQK